jgi:23S rRNA (cytosine1962-C5)-methyltransferase
MTYELIDSGGGKKLERFGDLVLIRPSSQALWQPELPEAWKRADASFSREGGWRHSRKVPDSWVVEIDGLKLKAALTDFGHLGIFPEHAQLWSPVRHLIKRGMRILNLFAYSGSATLAAAQQGGEVCHVDAAKGMVQWARDNARLNQLEKAPIRWIVEDVKKISCSRAEEGFSL